MATPSDPQAAPPADNTTQENGTTQKNDTAQANAGPENSSDEEFTMPLITNGRPFEDAYTKAFNNNSLWRRSLAETEPELFESLGKGQSPQILWIGCADSRCPETTILGLQPGEIFCHRNIANILVNTDINSLSVIQYAVQYLKVKHIIICGHTSCGGIAAALGNKKLGLIDTWLMPLRALRQENLSLLDTLNETEKGIKMVELNVRAGVKVLHSNPIVIDAMSERGLQVHGLIYNVGTGELRELDIEEEEEIVKSRIVSFKTED
ncbi:carbonic anhydrase [Exophiala aquamarina CBS 119918]|uniref:Carbonic anhydrase n=1 Tax=Exophiala aquamarina CBS 119918 TaxID=1182545 RepID=A0A072PCS1_9EURO|nr:carbonic anhydrase [Exophiala aquamarina CBS 119918]KEF57646.1 carbonic anhydrase [Exophiala aquamarina CBS 119918]